MDKFDICFRAPPLRQKVCYCPAGTENAEVCRAYTRGRRAYHVL